MNDQILRGLARREEEEVARLLLQRIPASQPATVLLYQPPTQLRESGELVDVGPRPSGAPNERVVQAPSSGRTGSFLHDPRYSERFIPAAELISEEDRRSYLEATPPEDRAKQVALERTRYPHIVWSSEDGPPVGSYIHHLSISPPVQDMHSERVPSLGVVYTITTDSASEERAVQRLVHCSQVAASVTLALRARLLLGDQLSCLAPLFRNPRVSLPEDHLFRLSVAFLLSHHWFYPHSPVAFLTIDRLSAPPVNGAYLESSWCPPAFIPSAARYSLDDSIEILAADLLQLAGYTLDLPAREVTPATKRRLRPFIASSLCHLVRQVAIIEWDSLIPHRVNRVERAFRAGDHIALIPPLEEELKPLDLTVPIWDLSSLLDLEERRSKKSGGGNDGSYYNRILAGASPGGAAATLDRSYKKPEYCIVSWAKPTADINELSRSENPEIFARLPWFTRYARASVLGPQVLAQCGGKHDAD